MQRQAEKNQVRKIQAGKIQEGKVQQGKIKVAGLVGAALVFAIVFAGYVAAGPLMTMHRIQTGLSSNDSQLLEKNINFETLRASIKTQLNQQMEKTTDQALGANSNNPMASLAKAFLSQAVDKIVEHSLTPQGLANLMRGKTQKAPGKNSADKPDDNTTTQTEVGQGNTTEEETINTTANREPTNILDQADMTFDSTSQCSFWVTGNDGKKTRIVFTRYGMRWKLSDIRLPDAAAGS